VSNFPTLSKKQDSKYFSESAIDPVMKTKVDGGYVMTRAKYTRTPRRTFTTGFSLITDNDKALLQTFWSDVKGGSDAFEYTHPISSESVTVRFTGSYTFKYAGAGDNYRWDVSSIQMEEV